MNLDATTELLARLRAQGRSPRLVFASTIAVYGDLLPALVDEGTPAAPAMSYGAHKTAVRQRLQPARRQTNLRQLAPWRIRPPTVNRLE